MEQLWPESLPESVEQLRPILLAAATYLQEHPKCANALFAVAAVCGIASPLYCASRDLISKTLKDSFAVWAHNTPRDEQIAWLQQLGGGCGVT